MIKTRNKRKSLKNRFTYAYIRKVRKWMYCPECKDGKMKIDKDDTMWECENCDYQLSADEFEDDYVFWFCENCNDFLNNQKSFKRSAKSHVCTNCGFENITTLNTSDSANKKSENSTNYLSIIGKLALAAGAVYMVSRCTNSIISRRGTNE